MGKRIYEIAKEIGKSSNEIIDVLKKNNIEKTNFSGVDAKEMDIITKAFAKKQEAPVKKEQPKQAVPVQKQEQPKQAAQNAGNRNNQPQQNRNFENRQGGQRPWHRQTALRAECQLFRGSAQSRLRRSDTAP